jgi:hypothetical protein
MSGEGSQGPEQRPKAIPRVLSKGPRVLSKGRRALRKTKGHEQVPMESSREQVESGAPRITMQVSARLGMNRWTWMLHSEFRNPGPVGLFLALSCIVIASKQIGWS